jgi:hypothetical protein
MRRTIAILLLALTCGGFVSCSEKDTVTPQPEENQNQGTSQATLQNLVILSKTELRDSAFQGIWQPTESDVRRIIQEAHLCVEKLKKTASSNHERKQIGEVLATWDKYYCQAIGHTKDGKKLIHLNFFLHVFPDEMIGTDWRHYYINQFGGSWRIEYDGEAKKFLDFHVKNGY